MDATPAGALPPFLVTILGLAGPLLKQFIPILIAQLGPILTNLLNTWLGGLTVTPVVPPVVPTIPAPSRGPLPGIE